MADVQSLIWLTHQTKKLHMRYLDNKIHWSNGTKVSRTRGMQLGRHEGTFEGTKAKSAPDRSQMYCWLWPESSSRIHRKMIKRAFPVEVDIWTELDRIKYCSFSLCRQGPLRAAKSEEMLIKLSTTWQTLTCATQRFVLDWCKRTPSYGKHSWKTTRVSPFEFNGGYIALNTL